MYLDHFGSVTSIEEITCLYRLRSEIIYSPPAANNSLKVSFVVDQTTLDLMVTLKNLECDIYIDNSWQM